MDQAKMYKRLALFIICVTLCLTLSAKGKLSLAMTWGPSLISGGDTNRFLMNQGIQASGGQPFDLVRLGNEASAEIRFSLRPRWSLFFSASILRAARHYNFFYSAVPAGSPAYYFNHEISAKPLQLGIHHRLGGKGRWSFGWQAAMGWYFTNWNALTLYDYDSSKAMERFETALRAKGGSIGGQVAAWLEYRMEKFMSVTIELSGRYARINNLRGKENPYYSQTKYEGLLYYYEYYRSSANAWVNRMTMAGPPAGQEVRNLRPAVVDLTGVALRLGLVIHP